MLGQRTTLPVVHQAHRSGGSAEGYVYLFDLAGRLGAPADKLVDMVLQNHYVNWTGFVVRDNDNGGGMLWVATHPM